MSTEVKITRIEIEPFTWDVEGLGWSPEGKPIYDPQAVATRKAVGARFHTDVGLVGEYVGGADVETLATVADDLLGTNALADRKSVV